MRRLLWILPLLPLMGCATLADLFRAGVREPTLRFVRADLAQVSLSDATVNLVYEVENPNPLGISVAEIDYAFSVEGHSVVAGAPPLGLNIPAEGKAELVFPAKVTFRDLFPALETFLNKDLASYRAEGHIGVRTPLGILKLPVSKEGQFEVPKLPQVAFGSPRVGNLSLVSATVEIPLTVTNRNSYALPIQAISGALTIAGAPVGNLAAPNLGTLEGKAQKEILLPVTVHFAQALAAARALQGGSAPVAWNSVVSSGGAQLPLHLQQQLMFRK